MKTIHVFYMIFSFSCSFAESGKDLEQAFDVLKSENVKLNQMLTSLTTYTNDLLRTIERLETRVSRLETGSNGNKRVDNNVSDEYLRVHNSSAERSMSRRQAAQTKVAFTYQNKNDIGHLGHDHPLKFTSRVTDITSGYSTVTGEFTAPVPGYYVFFLAARADSSTICWCDITKNGNPLITSFAQSSANAHNSDSSMAVVHLNVGDKVWARNKGLGDYRCELDDLSNFSGFLLYPD